MACLEASEDWGGLSPEAGAYSREPRSMSFTLSCPWYHPQGRWWVVPGAKKYGKNLGSHEESSRLGVDREWSIERPLGKRGAPCSPGWLQRLLLPRVSPPPWENDAEHRLLTVRGVGTRAQRFWSHTAHGADIWGALRMSLTLVNGLHSKNPTKCAGPPG